MIQLKQLITKNTYFCDIYTAYITLHTSIHLYLHAYTLLRIKYLHTNSRTYTRTHTHSDTHANKHLNNSWKSALKFKIEFVNDDDQSGLVPYWPSYFTCGCRQIIDSQNSGHYTLQNCFTVNWNVHVSQ